MDAHRAAGEVADAPHPGLQLFARYAYPPNERGYCGPEDHRALLAAATGGTTDPHLAVLARGFIGPWPYVQLIADAAGIADPFDARVVEAYWVGSPLLDQVARDDMGAKLRAELLPRLGTRWSALAEQLPAGVTCHHSLHVLGVYPWADLLHAGMVEQALHVLDECRIRWGQVVSVDGTEALVRCQRLVWDGATLRLGASRLETVVWARDGTDFVTDVSAGDWVSLHWRWLCNRLSAAQRQQLRHHTGHHLDLMNRAYASAPCDADAAAPR